MASVPGAGGLPTGTSDDKGGWAATWWEDQLQQGAQPACEIQGHKRSCTVNKGTQQVEAPGRHEISDDGKNSDMPLHKGPRKPWARVSVYSCTVLKAGVHRCARNLSEQKDCPLSSLSLPRGLPVMFSDSGWPNPQDPCETH